MISTSVSFAFSWFRWHGPMRRHACDPNTEESPLSCEVTTKVVVKWDLDILAPILNWIFVKHNFDLKILHQNLHKNMFQFTYSQLWFQHCVETLNFNINKFSDLRIDFIAYLISLKSCLVKIDLNSHEITALYVYWSTKVAWKTFNLTTDLLTPFLIGSCHEMFTCLAHHDKAFKLLHHKSAHETIISYILSDWFNNW